MNYLGLETGKSLFHIEDLEFGNSCPYTDLFERLGERTPVWSNRAITINI